MNEPTPLTELPLDLPGRLFGSPMPFGPSDPRGAALTAFTTQRISVVVLLASLRECLRFSGRDLPAVYRQAGLQLLHLPVPDFGVPEPAELEPVLGETIAHLEAGRNVVIHCVAGVGRTGTLGACLARRVLGLSGDRAIRWIRRRIPDALEGAAQQAFARNFAP